MPRNREKNAYFTVGIPYTSSVYKHLVAESQDTGTSIGKLIPVKLNELYAGVILRSSDETPKAQVKGAEANALAFLDSEDE